LFCCWFADDQIALKIKEEDRGPMREMNSDGRWIFINGNMAKLQEYV
jgi:hypothetical protein